MHKTIYGLLLLVAPGFWIAASAADKKPTNTDQKNFPIATQTLLNGVTSTESKSVIKSVLMIQCPKDGIKGTGFVLSGGGTITTNSHVIGNCSADELVGTSAVSNEPVKFSGLVRDPDRDLALLCATKPLPFDLKLSGSEKPAVETEVETWGYPLRYQSPAPLLSRGYVAGYWAEQRRQDNGQPGKPVEHLIVNGALNPGNSGGPLIDRATGKVIGIVVEKWTLFSPNVESVVTALEHPGGGFGGGVPIYVRYPDGEVKQVSQTEGIRVALKEIYDASQVMIGEAISVSELNAFIKEKREGLVCASH
jgi:S1-C subfamily serine protease